MSLELGLIVGLIGVSYMTLQISEKLNRKENEISVTVIALSQLFSVGVLYGGYTLAKNASLTGMENVYLGGLLVGVLTYIIFLYLVVKTYKEKAANQGLSSL